MQALFENQISDRFSVVYPDPFRFIHIYEL
jgi:hypothetical protein